MPANSRWDLIQRLKGQAGIYQKINQNFIVVIVCEVSRLYFAGHKMHKTVRNRELLNRGLLPAAVCTSQAYTEIFVEKSELVAETAH